MHRAYACKLGDSVLAGVTQIDAATNPDIQSDIGAGSIYPQFAATVAVRPRVQFQSRAIASVLALTGITGSDAFTDLAPFIAYLAELEAGLTTGDAITYSMNRGVLVPRRLSCSHRQDAILDLEALSYSEDGAVDPLTVGSVLELPTLTRDNIRHTLKSAEVGGVALGCITDVSIEFGNSVDTLGCQSDIYDRHLAYEQGIASRITITTLDIAKLGASTIPLKGKGAAHADSSIIFRQRATDGIGFAADSEDIEITASGLAVYSTVSGQGAANASAVVEITCHWDGTNAPLIIS